MLKYLSAESVLFYLPLLAAAGLSAFLAIRLKMTKKLMEQQQKHAQTLFDHNGSGHLIVSSTRQILEVNHQFCALFGYEKKELIGQSALILHLDREHYEAWAPRFQDARGGMALGSADYPWRRKDGTVFWCAFTGVRLALADGNPGVIWSVIDITERKQMEDTLRGSEQRFREIFNNVSDPVYISDLSGRIVAANEQAFAELGYTLDELLQMRVMDLDGIHIDTETLAEYFRALSEKKALTFESVHRRKDGSLLQVEVNTRLIEFDGQPAVLGVARNITERKRAEEEHLQLEKQLLHAQKLESLGVLAGGIAHDFNNILTSIMGNADLALMRLNPESPAVDNLRRIEQSAARAADLAKQMLAYSGKGKFVIELLDINRLVEEMLHMLEVSISKKAVMRLNLHRPLPGVEADATQLRQIIMNLVINASEAIGEKSGVIAISTGCMACDHNYLKDVWLDENLSEGLYVYLEIADSGCGMDRETLAKIFDPFFTTKFTGRGLGMAAVLGIVRGHKGAIKVYSEPNKGTTFKVLLPAGNKPVELFNSEPHAEEWQGSGTVLLVDDEETVRAIGSDMLRALGFKVITADDGRHALEQYSANPEISLVILDLTMPHLDGEQTFRELRRINPQVKVIMSSGYNEYEVNQKFVGKGLAGFVQKPYTLSVLQEVVRGVMP